MADKSEFSDEEIINLLKSGDTRAPSLLYKAHYKAVYNSAKKFVQNSDEAKDIAQELFINLWEKRNILNISIPIRKYLLSAVHHRVINFKRDSARYKRLMREVVDRSGSDKIANAVDVNIEAKELERIIKDAIALLPYNIRKNFTLSRNLGMTYKEIAAHLKVSDKAVEKSMTKALKPLRLLLTSYLKGLLIIIHFKNIF